MREPAGDEGAPLMLLALAIVLTAIAFVRYRRDPKRRIFALMMPLALISDFAVGRALKAADAQLSEKFDLFLYRTDLAIFGFSPGFTIAHLLDHSAILAAAAWCYWNIIAAALVVFFVHFMRRDGDPIRTVLLLVSAPFIGYALYYIVPACGPVYAFRGFPIHLPDPTPALANVAGPPNAMPSVHLSLALFFIWLCRKWRFASFFTIPFAALIAIATLALGEHYAIDLIVAVPFAAACFLAFERRVFEAALCAALVFIPMLVLRFDPTFADQHLSVTRAFCLLAVAASVYATSTRADEPESLPIPVTE